MSYNLPQVEVELKNVRTGKWETIQMGLDPGSDVTNLPVSYADRLGVDLSREWPLQVGTVGGDITGYLVDMEMMIQGVSFTAPVVFRTSNISPLLGKYPLTNYFELNMIGDSATLTPLSTGSSIYQMKLMAYSLGLRLLGGGK